MGIGADDSDDLDRVAAKFGTLGVAVEHQGDSLTAVEPIGGIRAILSLAERLRQAPEPPTPYKGPGRVERQGRPPGVLRDGPVRPRKFGHVGAVSTVVRIEPSAVGSATVAMSAGIQSAVSQDGLAGNEAGADPFGLQK